MCGRPVLRAFSWGKAFCRPTQLIPRKHKRLKHRRGSSQPSSSSVAHISAVISPGICFDTACQQAADRAFLVAVALPLLGLLFAILWKLRTPEAKTDEGEVMRCLLSTSFDARELNGPQLFSKASPVHDICPQLDKAFACNSSLARSDLRSKV